MSSTRQLGSSTSHTTSQLRVTAVRDIEKKYFEEERNERNQYIYEYDVFNGHMPKERERKEKDIFVW